MPRIGSVSLTLAGLALLCAAPVLEIRAQAQQNAAAEKAAQQAAKSWLSLTDSGKYAESWSTAADAFKKAVTREKWVTMVKPVRDPLGKSKSRKLKLSRYAKDPPKAPKGEYVTIQYDTGFEKKPAAVETIVEMREKDGKWRTGGYFIR